MLIRSAELDQLQPSGLVSVRALRPARLIDLRSPFEITSPHPLLGERYFRALPWIDPHRDLERDRAVERTKADVYIGSLERNGVHVAAIVREIAGAPAGPVIVHCQAGADRTGMLCALLLQVAGVMPEAIIDDYLASTQDPLGGRPPVPSVAVDDVPASLQPITADTMRATLDHVARHYGGGSGYLTSVGVSPDAIARIGNRLAGVR